MITGKFTRLLFCLFLPVLSFTSNPARAQDSFTVSGPLSFYTDYATGFYTDHSFSATISYDPSTPPSGQSSSLGNYEEAYFVDAVVSIVYSIYDAAGNEVANVLEDGMTLGTYIRALNDISGSNGDELEYNSGSMSNNHVGQAIIQFSESSGILIDDLLDVPEAPGLGDFEDSSVQFDMFQFNDAGVPTSGLAAIGEITMVSGGETSPFDECALQASNHGQYVSCIAHVNNLLRADGEISGQEKGQLQKDAAKSK